MQNQEYDEWLAKPEVQKKLAPVRKLQGVLLEMLLTLDKVCRNNGLRYCLFYGTLLGAIRHQGFIPWDDDADIVMPRADYDRLLKLPREAWPVGYFLQSPYSERNSRFAFAKLRKDGTACITDHHAHIRMHQGIFVDIFPLDSTSPRTRLLLWNIPRIFERLAAFSCANLPGWMRVLSPVQCIWRKLLSPSFFSRIGNSIARYLSVDGGIMLDTFSTERSPIFAMGYKVSDLFPAKWVMFDGCKLAVPNNAESILKFVYGQWESFPPEEHRIPIHSSGGVIDTCRDYTEYLKK